ncbi:MAG: S41 family peptidase, partial [Gemmatimonadota bacterium]
MPTCCTRGFRLGLVLLLLRLAPLTAQAAAYEQLQTFSSLLNQVRQNYVDSVVYSDLVTAAIEGVLSSLDPHSRFEREADAEREMAYMTGHLAGAGVSFDQVDDQLVVLAVMARGPAARAGMTPGDRVLSINDTSVAGLTSDEVSRQVMGDKGRKIRLVLGRGSRLEPDTIRVGLKLDFLPARSVGTTRMIDPTTGYIHLDEFQMKGGDEVAKSVKQLQSKGARQLVLDLRSNPGGAVSAAIEIAALFLPAQAVIYRTVARRERLNE